MPLARIESVDTAFQRVEVWKSEMESEFRVEGAIHAWWNQKRFLTGLAWDNLAAGALLRPGGPPRSILMLGLAGGTAFRILRQLKIHLLHLEGAAAVLELNTIPIGAAIEELGPTELAIVFGLRYQPDNAYAPLEEQRPCGTRGCLQSDLDLHWGLIFCGKLALGSDRRRRR
jgi:hypothetical protein